MRTARSSEKGGSAARRERLPHVTIHEFLSRFEKVKKAGGQWLVCCPAHQDSTPSLAVKAGSDGTILLTDHGGCSTDAILQAMGLEPAALFPEKDAPARTVVATYDYRDESGTLLYQAVRFRPKGFSQRRPNGSDWIYNLQGVRRVLYRLPELLGQHVILVCEGEKDVDRAWSLGIPATCNPMGAGKWDGSYVGQLHAAGTKKAAILPDNDAQGRAHAHAVAQSLHAGGLEVRIVPLPGVPVAGDLSDFLDRQTKDDLVALLRAAAVWTPAVVLEEQLVKHFEELGEQRYRLSVPGVTLEVSRLRRTSQELIGELLVRVTGSFPDAKTFGDRILQVGDMNFSSTNMRQTRAKLLAERSGNNSCDWYGWIEEFVTSVIAAERRGTPAEALAETTVDDESVAAWDVSGFPILQSLPQVIFGSSASGKSYLAMWLAGELANQGMSVLYADWEFSKAEHRRRLQRLFQPMPKNLLYIRCEHPLKHETDHLVDIIHKHQTQFIVCDSIGFATEGPAEAQEGAATYFRCLRQLGIGSLNIAHVPKQYDDNREAQPFGSVFYTNGARSIWFIDRAKENPLGEIRFGLYHRKNNVGALLQPKGFKLTFRGDRTFMDVINLKDVEELAAGYPLLDRMKEALKPGPMSPKALAEELNVSVGQIRATANRHKSQFLKLGPKIGVPSAGEVVDDAAEF